MKTRKGCFATLTLLLSIVWSAAADDLENSVLFFESFESRDLATANEGMVSGPVQFVEGKEGNGASFDTRQAYIVYPSEGNMTAEQGTIELWFKPSEEFVEAGRKASHILFVTQGGFNPNNFIIAYRGGRFVAMIYDKKGPWAFGIPRLEKMPEANKWYHLALTWVLDNGKGGGDVDFYIDGEACPKRPVKRAGEFDSLPSFSVGAWAGYKRNPALGTIDSLRICNRPLNPRDFLINRPYKPELPEAAKKGPALVRFFLFRRDFFEGETGIRGFYRAGRAPEGDERRIAFELRDGERILARQEPGPLTGETQFLLETPPLRPGRKVFVVRVTDGRGETAYEDTRTLDIEAPALVERRRISLRIDEPAGVVRPAWPIAAGVPFGKGMLPVEDVKSHTRVLDAKGVELPCQARTLATWTDAKRYARWVLFDFQGDLAAGAGAEFAVEFGKSVRRGAGPAGDIARRTAEGAVAVDTGKLRVAFSPERPVFFDNVLLDGKRVTRPVQSGELYLIFDESGKADKPELRTYLAESRPGDFRLEIESNGPMRAVVKAAGWYGNRNNERLFRYIVRLYFHRDKSLVQGFYTLIATEPGKLIHSMGLRLRTDAPPAAALFGGEKGNAVRVAPLPNEVALAHPETRTWVVGETGPNKGRAYASGRRAEGWAQTASSETGLLVGIKDFWREFPKELRVRRDGVVELQFVGESGPHHMDLRPADSQGVAKTTRFVIDFQPPHREDRQAAAYAAATLSDPAPWVDPNRIRAADPFWAPVTRCETDSEDPIKRAYANHVAMYPVTQPQAPETVNGLHRYGLVNYGDRIHNMASRGWFNNEDYYVPYQEWVGYLATGNRRLFDAVTSFTRHLVDIDTLNYTTGDPGLLGLQARHKPVHWAQPAIVTHTYVDQSLLYYYLCGYERGADHAELLRQGQRVWDWWPDPGWWTPESRFGAVSRDYGVNLRILMNVYRHTWDPALLVRAHELWSRYAAGFSEAWTHPAGYFNVPRGVELYARYTRDPSALEAVRNVPEDDFCPVLKADLGKPEALARWRGRLAVALSDCFEFEAPPPWALAEQIHWTGLLNALAIGGIEKAREQGRPIEPVESEPVHLRGTRELWFLEERDAGHDLRVQIWVSGSREAKNAHLTVLGPDGRKVIDKPIDTGELPPATHGHYLDFRVPGDGVTGVYRVRLEKFVAPYLRFWFAKAPEKRVYVLPEERFDLGAWNGTRFWFYVPEDCVEFKIGSSPQNRSTRFGFAVYDDKGVRTAGQAWYHNVEDGPASPRWVAVRPEAQSRGKWWSIGYTCAKGMYFTWPKALPPFVADSPTSGFLPGEIRK